MNTRRLFPLVTALLMIVSVMTLSVSAVDLPSEEIIDETLRTRGYPQPVLDIMAPQAKRDLYADTSRHFNGGVITAYNEESGTFTEYQFPANGIMTIDQIPTSDLMLLFLVSGDDSNEDLLNIEYHYIWYNLPFWRFQDPIGVSWDDTLFRLETGSFHKVDYYDATWYDPNGGVIDTVTEAIQSNEFGFANSSPSGVTWYADLRGYDEWTPTALYGYGKFNLEKLNSNATGSSIIYGRYVHSKGNISLGLNIFEYGSISVSGGSNYDERATQFTFNY